MKHRVARISIAILLVVALAGAVLANVETARVRVENSLYFITNGWLNEAFDQLVRAVEVAPEHAEAHLLLGMLFDTAGQSRQAIEAYERYARLDADNAAVYAFIGNIYLDEGNLPAARRAFETTLRAMPESGLAHYGLARTKQLNGDDDAMASYATALEHAPDLVEARLHYATLLRAEGRTEEALDHLLHANRTDSQVAAVRLELARTYEVLERYDEARAEYRFVLRLDPANTAAATGLEQLPPSP